MICIPMLVLQHLIYIIINIAQKKMADLECQQLEIGLNSHAEAPSNIITPAKILLNLGKTPKKFEYWGGSPMSF